MAQLDFPQWKFSLFFMGIPPKGTAWPSDPKSKEAEAALWTYDGVLLELTQCVIQQQPQQMAVLLSLPSLTHSLLCCSLTATMAPRLTLTLSHTTMATWSHTVDLVRSLTTHTVEHGSHSCAYHRVHDSHTHTNTGHIAVMTKDVYKASEELEKNGVGFKVCVCVQLVEHTQQRA